MTNLVKWLGRQTGERSDALVGLDEWANWFGFQGLQYPVIPTQTLGSRQEEIATSFQGYVDGAYKANGVVFACMLVRQLLFSEARFQFRQIRQGRPGDLFGTQALSILENPWTNGTTGDLLTHAIQDADLAGNFYCARDGKTLRRLRPDWVTIVMGSQTDSENASWQLDAEVIGYIYHPGGRQSREPPVILLADQVAHFAPIPDPTARFRGMSWLTPVLREIMADGAATTHKLKFFEQGAPQSLDSKILTPNGWSTMGEMKVGSEVIGPHGRSRVVTAVYPQGERDIYRVQFSDGASTECTKDHIWRVSNGYKERTMSLAEIEANGTHYPSGNPKWSVPYVDPVEFAETNSELPLDPYFLGLLLGDGSFRGNYVSLSGAASDVVETERAVVSVLPEKTSMRQRNRGNWSEWYFNGPGAPVRNPLNTIVRELGLFGVIGHEKFIPEPYMTASIGDRIALLQGLVDSDGHVDYVDGQGCAVTVTTNSPQLAQQITDLVGSLGGWGTIACDSRDAGRDKVRRLVKIKRLPDWIIPCRLERKVASYHAITRVQRRRFIKAIEFVGRKPAQCIRVDSEDSLYVTDDYILTHNTPNMVVSLAPEITPQTFKEFVEIFEDSHEGVLNAYKTMYLGGGADVKVVGSDLRQLDFKVTQGAGETRIAAAAGVPPVIAGFSEGLASATYSNYQQARRRLADATMRPLWRNFAGSLSTIVEVPNNSELWYDDRDIPFLQEDVKDAAEVQSIEGQTIATLVKEGFEPESVKDAIISQDWTRLVHSGLVSVQLLPPGTSQQSSSGSNGSGSSKPLPK